MVFKKNLISNLLDNLKYHGKINKMDEIALEIASILNELYEIIIRESRERKEQSKKYLMLRITDQSVSKNCTLTDIKAFKKRVIEITTTVGYELTTGWIIGDENAEEWEDISKILVKIDNTDIVKVEFQNEINQEKFDEILDKIEFLLRNKYGKLVEINNIKRDKSNSKVEYIDFGILGKYRYDRITYNTDEELTKEEKDIQIRKILSDYSLCLEDINKKIFHQIYNDLEATDCGMWETTCFSRILDWEKLPTNFKSLSEEEKINILYVNEYTDYNDLWNKIKDTKQFWDLNKMKDIMRITNIVIDTNFKNIIIEFNTSPYFYGAYIELKYNNNFNINEFNPD